MPLDSCYSAIFFSRSSSIRSLPSFSCRSNNFSSTRTSSILINKFSNSDSGSWIDIDVGQTWAGVGVRILCCGVCLILGVVVWRNPTVFRWPDGPMHFGCGSGIQVSCPPAIGLMCLVVHPPLPSETIAPLVPSFSHDYCDRPTSRKREKC